MYRATLLIVFLITFGFNASSQIEFNCDDNQTAVLIQLDVNLEAEDIEWGLVSGDTLIADGYTGATESHELCLYDGCYELSLYNITDTEWDGVVSVLMENGVVASADLDSDPTVLHFGVNSEGCGEGCTDPDALNYEEDATIDDGSCILPGDCDGSWVEIELETEYEADEITWYLLNANEEEIYAGTGFENFSEYHEWLCLEDGCYTLQMFAVNGWNGAEFSLSIGDEEIFETGMPDGNFGYINFGINAECDETVYLEGCTDPEAVNYDPEATEDNGSCEYLECDNIPVTIDFETNVGLEDIEWELELVTFDFDIEEGNAGGSQNINLCLADSGCYALNLSDNSFTGWNGNVSIIANDEVVAFYDFNDDATEASLNFSFNVDPCGEGCTDPAAVNYDDDATIDDGSCLYPDDCEVSWVELEIETEDGGGQVSWNIVQDEVEIYGDGGYESYSENSHWICLEDGCYTFELFDSAGNGWNGGEFSIELDGEDILEGTLPNGEYGFMQFNINSPDCGDEVSLPGCTDPEATNYSEVATVDDGSCIYPECSGTVVSFQVDVNLGENDIEYGVFSGDTLFADGYTGGTNIVEVCLQDGCHTIELYNLTDTQWDGVITVFADNEMIAGGNLGEGDPHIVYFGINEEGCGEGEIAGCTDPEALNYDPEANVDDGSCIYPPECFIDFVLTASENFPNTIFVIPNDSIEDAESIEWDFGDGSVSGEIYPDYDYDGDGPYTLCLTVVFETEDEEECEATFCLEISADMIPDLIPGFGGSAGFSINVIDDASTIGVGELENELSFEFYPNPAGDQLNVDVFNSTSPEAELLVRDLNGRVVKSVDLDLAGSSSENSIDVSEISSGVYIITLKTEQSNINKRMIKK
ncbi:T9SS type A sorting domain-containing protein [Halocola ammonii]